MAGGVALLESGAAKKRGAEILIEYPSEESYGGSPRTNINWRLGHPVEVCLGAARIFYPPLCQKSRRAVGSTPFEASSPFVERRLDLGDRLIEHRPNVEFAIILSG